MKKLLTLAKRFQSICDEAGRDFCFIGGLAVQRWGEPRVTGDVDAALHAGLGEEASAIAMLQEGFAFREENSLEKAKITRVLLLRDPGSGVELDVSLAAAEFEFGAIARSTRETFAEATDLQVCSPEDLIVYKAFAARAIDWRDVEGILIRQQGRLDFAQIEVNLRPLCELKEDPEIYAHYETLRDRYR